MRRKKILVTGGAGFIGHHLCVKLSENKASEVFSLDNYSSGTKHNHIKGVQYLTGDTKNILSELNFVPDVIYHLGEYSRVEQSLAEPGKVLDFNLSGTAAIVEFCRINNSKLIYAGSSTKFGDGGKNVNKSPYGFTKSMNTELIKNYGEWYGLNYAICYFYNAYGDREIEVGEYATVVAKFKKQYLEGQPLTITLPGSQVRNFTHVSDIVTGLVLVGENCYGDGYGIGSDEEYSIIELAQLFGSQVEYLPAQLANRSMASLETDKLKSLGWTPKIKLKEHISEWKNNVKIA